MVLVDEKYKLEKHSYSNYLMQFFTSYILKQMRWWYNLVVAGVGEASLGEELLLDQTRAGEAAKDIGAAGLVVGATGTSTTK